MLIVRTKECMSESQTLSFREKINERIDILRSRRGWAWHPVIKKEKWSRGAKFVRKVNGVMNTIDSEERRVVLALDNSRG